MKENIPSKEQYMQIRSHKLKLNMGKNEIRSFKIRKQDADRLEVVEFVIGNLSIVQIEQPLLSSLPVQDGLVELLHGYTPCLPSHASVPDYNAYFVYTYKVDHFTGTPVVKAKSRVLDVPHFQSFSKYLLNQIDEYTKINGIFKTLEDVSKLLTTTKEDVSVKRHKVDTPAIWLEGEERVIEDDTFAIKHVYKITSGELEVGVPVVMKEYEIEPKRVNELIVFGKVQDDEVRFGEHVVKLQDHSQYKNAKVAKIPDDVWDAWETILMMGKGTVDVFIEQPNMLGVKQGMFGCRYTS